MRFLILRQHGIMDYRWVATHQYFNIESNVVDLDTALTRAFIQRREAGPWSAH